MKSIVLIISSFLVLPFVVIGQTKSKLLKVYCITEYIDGYVIKGIDVPKNDTLNIISAKESMSDKKKYNKIRVGETYNFEYTNYVAASFATANSFTIRIKTTIVWRSTDEKSSRPVFSQNTKGLWIEK